MEPIGLLLDGADHVVEPLRHAHRGSPIDLLAMGVALVGQSVPNFWLAIMMILLFAVSWGLLPTSGRGGGHTW